MRYLSVCSGIEAASVAWRGWSPVAFSEIEAFPSAVLAHHYPDVPNWGDMNEWRKWPDADVDVLVGGTPCQSFSVAGLRAGLDDSRGNLALAFCALAERYRPLWVVWENVPGVLSSNGGRDFGSIIGALAELGYGVCYRVLDAQYVRVDGFARGVPQRRRRVFVVGYSGDWRRAAEVLFEPESLRGDSPPRRTTGQEVARPLGASPSDLRSPNIGSGQGNVVTEPYIPDVCGTLSDGAHRGGGLNGQDVYTGRVIAFNWQNGGGYGKAKRVRRLTPVECERLMGFPDNYTDIPGAYVSSRYKALGNSMAVNVMRWIGERIELATEG